MVLCREDLEGSPMCEKRLRRFTGDERPPEKPVGISPMTALEGTKEGSPMMHVELELDNREGSTPCGRGSARFTGGGAVCRSGRFPGEAGGAERAREGSRFTWGRPILGAAGRFAMALDFSSQTKQQIDALTRLPEPSGRFVAGVERLAQDEFGHHPDEVVELVSSTLALPVAHVYGVVTFYTMFGRQIDGAWSLLVCTNAVHAQGRLRHPRGLVPGHQGRQRSHPTAHSP